MSDNNSPSEVLTAAADRVRDLAAAATVTPWHATGDDRDERPGAGRHCDVQAYTGYGWEPILKQVGRHDARWIAALSPAVAPALELILRHTAERWAKTATVAEQYDCSPDDWMTDSDRATLALAGVILVMEVTEDDR